jgi:hypothetical protein
MPCETNTDIKYPVILSFDVGVIHLSYCLMTKKLFKQKWFTIAQSLEFFNLIEYIEELVNLILHISRLFFKFFLQRSLRNV